MSNNLDFLTHKKDNNLSMENTSKIINDFNQYYANNELDKAISLIQDNKVIFDSATYHQFLGTSLAKKGDFALARLELEKAKLHGNFDSKINNNIEYIREKLNLVELEETQGFFESLKFSVLNLDGQWLLSISLVTLITIMIFYRRLNKYLTAAVILFTLIFISLNFINFNQQVYCIALSEKKIFEGPSEIFAEANLIPSGTKYYLGERSGDFVFLEFPSKLQGWIKVEKKECVNFHE